MVPASDASHLSAELLKSVAGVDIQAVLRGTVMLPDLLAALSP
jgi:hypothetical protein